MVFMERSLLTSCGTLLLLLIGAVTGFGAASTEAAGTTSERIPLELTKAYFFNSGTPGEFPEQEEEWIAFISDRYHVDLKVNSFPRPEYMEKFALSLSSGDIKGIGWIFGGTYMEDYFNDGATVALDEYLEGNANWAALPELMRTTNVRNGELIALPSGFTGLLAFGRAIRTDWLENLGLPMPTTVDELYNAVRAFTLDDPDGNGQDDTFGMTAAGVWNLQDIFMSFGVPTNHVGDHLITPDPHDGLRYNDGFLKPGVHDALSWLRRVYEEGLLDQEIFTNGGSQMRERMYSGQYGSTFYWARWAFAGNFENQAKKVDPNATFDLILGLTSANVKSAVNTGGIRNGGAPWVAIAGTRNLEEQVNAFVDIFFGDEVGYWSGRYGVQGKHWAFGPNREIVRQIRETVDGKPSYYRGPGITVDTPTLNHREYPHVLDGEEPAATARRIEITERTYSLLDQGLSSGLLYSYPHPWAEPNSPTYLDIAADIKRIFNEQVARAVTGQATVEEAVAEYRDQVGKLGGQKVLDEANAAIGKTSSSVYRF